MNATRSQQKKVPFWGIVLVGLVLPWLVRMGVEISFNPRDFFKVLLGFPSLLFAPGHNLFLIGALNDIPFIVLAILARRLMSGREGAAAGVFFPRLAGLIGVSLAVIVQSLGVHLSVWMDLFGPGRPSSTAVITFVFLPLYSVLMMPIGYGIGWLVGKVIFWLRHRSSPQSL